MNTKTAQKPLTGIMSKYDVQVPRYTSYPTVPYWQKEMPQVKEWSDHLSRMFGLYNDDGGISLYIHLPFCESLCTYCGCNKRITVNHQVEEGYIGSLLKEWSMYLDLFGRSPRISEIHLGGGTPTFFSSENLSVLLRGILDKSELLPGAELGFEAHPNNTTTQHLAVLADLGFRRISIGVQDFDVRVQQLINRRQTFERVEEVTREARQLGYDSINFDLIYGLPQQRPESIEDTMKKVALLRPDRIAFYSYAHVPWKSPGQRGYSEADLPAGEAKRALYELGKTLLLKAGYREIGMDHFALPSDTLYRSMEKGKLHRNFMGYTNSQAKVLIGLGASSISDAWSCMVQNARSVEQYQEIISKGELPIVKGHVLSGEDSILRQHILNLICRYETSWRNPQLQTPFLEKSRELLAGMQDDGLVELSAEGAAVTETGKMFIRNICTAFDARLHARLPDTRVFSRSV